MERIRLQRAKKVASLAVLCAATLLAAAACVAQEQYPKPLIHTPTDHPAARVLLLSIDGLHAADLANWIVSHPHSALAELTARGVTYTNARSPSADPVAGLVSIATGGTPISTGILSSDGFDHALAPPNSNCKMSGTPLTLDQSLNTTSEISGFDIAKLPRDPNHECAPMQPHSLLRVNTMFEVVHEKIGSTAWAGESKASTDILRGPSGKGLDEDCAAETGITSDSDMDRVAVILHWIDGRDCKGDHNIAVPSLFGMSFVSVGKAQASAGYIDSFGTPSPALAKSLAATDNSIGRIIAELKTKQLYDTTWIFVTAPYCLSPMAPQAPCRSSRAQASAEPPRYSFC